MFASVFAGQLRRQETYTPVKSGNSFFFFFFRLFCASFSLRKFREGHFLRRERRRGMSGSVIETTVVIKTQKVCVIVNLAPFNYMFFSFS